MGYSAASARPLYSLAFLLPLLLAFEFGSLLLLAEAGPGEVRNIRAHSLLGDVFEQFGVAGLIAPSLLIVVILLVQHTLRRDPWKLRAGTLVGMGFESVAWAAPLVVLAALFGSALALVSFAQDEVLASGVALQEASWAVRVVVSLGAGLYEELLFRLIAITAMHLILSDVLRLKANAAGWIAVLVSAGAFAFYHDPSAISTLFSLNVPANWPWLAFLFCAGVYLGALYVLRGFGIAVGAHAAYDLVVLVILPAVMGSGEVPA